MAQAGSVAQASRGFRRRPQVVKGGAKAQIMSETDKKLYNLDSFEKVKALMGDKVTVKGKLDAATNTITVESAGKASQ